MVTRSFRAMGTCVRLFVDGGGDDALVDEGERDPLHGDLLGLRCGHRGAAECHEGNTHRKHRPDGLPHHGEGL